MSGISGAAKVRVPGTVFANPDAGNGNGEENLDALFAPHRVERCDPQDLADHVTALLGTSPGFVGVAGGDGSIRTAAGVLMGTAVPLLVVPTGTRNHFAGAVGLHSVTDARLALERGTTSRVDVGTVNGQVFVNTLVIGQYPDMVKRRRRHLDRFPKTLGTVAAALHQLRHGRKFNVVVDGTKHRVWAVFVGNGRYGSTLRDLTERPDISDGLLDVRIVDATGRLSRLRLLGAMLFGRLDRTPMVYYHTAPRVRIDLDRGEVDVAVDGEVLRLTPLLEVTCHPGALHVITDDTAHRRASDATSATSSTTSSTRSSTTTGASVPAAPVPTITDDAADDTHWAERLRELMAIHDLHLAPLDEVGSVARHQHHPTVAARKMELESELLARIDAATDHRGTRDHRSDAKASHDGLPGAGGSWAGASADEVMDALRQQAAASEVPAVYDWLAEQAPADKLWWFLGLEGGPDGGFDDLVAVAQVGLSGEPKLEMARNYWDEMGRGDLDAVHTELHRVMASVGDLPDLAAHELPVPALERLALGTTLATNRWLQPELVGALGLIELQAGPRCRRVATGLRRIGAPEDALPFYDEHATADPRHGKDWLTHVVTPLAMTSPRWAGGMVRGARWRATANARFLEDLSARLGVAA
jgi:diacylglycerol kinase family enzyme